MKPYNNICSHLIYPKNNVFKDDKPGVIYQIKCNVRTVRLLLLERQLKDQVAEHLKRSSCEHIVWVKHSFTTEEVSVLYQEKVV